MKYIHIYITNPNAESRTELSIESLQGVKRLHLMFLTQAPAAEGPQVGSRVKKYAFKEFEILQLEYVCLKSCVGV